jgi:hypothetical protein
MAEDVAAAKRLVEERGPLAQSNVTNACTGWTIMLDVMGATLGEDGWEA